MLYSEINTVLKENLIGLYPDREIEAIGRRIAEHLSGLNWIQIRLNTDMQLTKYQEDKLSIIFDRLKKHEPVQYVLGETEFYGIRLMVQPGVLIPRGETEELVEWIIRGESQGQRAAGSGPKGKKEQKEKIRILDIGCGSGAIAIALAQNMPDAEIVAADLSEDALQITRKNASLNGLNLTLFQFDILSALDPGKSKELIPNHNRSTFDIIVSNPPYIPLNEKQSMEHHVVDYEPEMALFVPDGDPLVFYRAIAEFATTHLIPRGKVYVEIHDRLGAETVKVFKKSFSQVELRKDIHGKDRMICASNG